MKPFCPSSGALLRGTLAFSQTRTSSRKVFSDSLRSKSMCPKSDLLRALRDRRQHIGGQQLKCVRVVEEEVLEHEEVDTHRGDVSHPLGDLFGGSDEPGVFPVVEHLVRGHSSQAADDLQTLPAALPNLPVAAPARVAGPVRI